MRDSRPVERWAIFEASWALPEEERPFIDVSLSAEFRHGDRVVEVEGFYDGNGAWRVRFMPDLAGDWSWVTRSNRQALDRRGGAFVCIEPGPANHGPVRVKDTYHFAYADGTPYFCLGTTAYGWAHQGPQMAEQTLATLRAGPFNKMRMLVFPKSFGAYCANEPSLYPFEPSGCADGRWNLDRFDPAFFQNIDRCVAALGALGVEADVILFHPYDRWGFANLPAPVEDRYVRYLVARLGAFRHVWWSLANEWDSCATRTVADWERIAAVITARDPYRRLCSIHNGAAHYDYSRPWLTHCSIQHHEAPRADECARWRRQYGKPVVIDENRYEGDLPHDWGSLSARELVHRFWLAAVGGAYNGHSETYAHVDHLIWWSRGGVLRGQSPPRLGFLRGILESGPPVGWTPAGPFSAAKGHDVVLYYFGVLQPGAWEMDVEPGLRYRAEIIDPWEMSVEVLPQPVGRSDLLKLPGRPHVAVRLTRQG